MQSHPSTDPIPNGRRVLNDGFGNRCVICGHYFDEMGMCANGHERNRTYYYPPEEKPQVQQAETRPESAKTMIICEVFSGNRCAICGGFFAEGEDICSVGGHEIGKQYPG